MTSPWGILLLAAILGADGCREAAPAPASATVTPAPSAADEAQAMDARAAVPLLPMMAEHQKEQMRGHLAAVQAIVAALARNDFAGVESAAAKIGYSDSMAQMCTHMGAASPDFTPTALAFHRTADTIADAARAKNRPAVLSALSATLETCVGCHAKYKAQAIDQATWTKLTSMPPPMGEHAGREPE